MLVFQQVHYRSETEDHIIIEEWMAPMAYYLPVLQQQNYYQNSKSRSFYFLQIKNFVRFPGPLRPRLHFQAGAAALKAVSARPISRLLADRKTIDESSINITPQPW